MSPETVSSLLSRIAEHGDEAALGKLFAYYAPRIKSYMMHEGADDATADNLARQAMAVVQREAHTFKPNRDVATAWIFNIARSLRVEKIRNERAWTLPPDAPTDEVQDGSVCHDEQDESEHSGHLQQAIRELPAELLEVVELCYLSGLSQAQVAERLSLPISTVKSRLRLAYAKLQSSPQNTDV